MDHKRRVAAEGPLARKRLKDQSHATTSPSPMMFLLGGSSNRAARSLDIQDLDKMVEDSTYRELLPVVRKELVIKRDVDMALIRRGVKRLKGGNQEEMVCAVCPTPKKFKGWGALLIHAERFVKEKARQHRGYFRALKQALQEEENSNSDGKYFQEYGRKDVQPLARSLSTAQAEEDDRVASWKPNILIVQDDKIDEVERIICPRASHRESEVNRHACSGMDRTAKPRLKEILAVYSSGKDGKRNVFVFPATEVGYINGKELTLACSKEHTTLEYNCDDHRNLSSKANEKAVSASISNMALKGWTNIKEKNGLKLLPDKEVNGRKGELFDDGKFDRIGKIMTRWADNFKAINRNFEVQRSFRLGSRMYELDRVWQDDLKRIESYAPSTKKKGNK
uniref:XS domain-containing protein n=1 Tax=Physcomitrium patens TaxID=3218 RepID=A0A7I4BB58_PHYPA